MRLKKNYHQIFPHLELCLPVLHLVCVALDKIVITFQPKKLSCINNPFSFSQLLISTVTVFKTRPVRIRGSLSDSAKPLKNKKLNIKMRRFCQCQSDNCNSLYFHTGKLKCLISQLLVFRNGKIIKPTCINYMHIYT